MKQELHSLLSNIREKLPPEKREAFAAGIRTRFNELNSLAEIDGVTVAKHSIFGMAIGAVMDVVPGLETLFGVDGFVDVGGALGAFVGLSKSAEEKRQRDKIREIIIQELNNIHVTP